MTDARYYVVGDHDVWMIKFKDGENGLCGRGDKSFVFAVDAAQKLGMWLNTLTSGINCPTSRAAIKNADDNLKRLRQAQTDGVFGGRHLGGDPLLVPRRCLGWGR
jgi:hypothetical protein